eukprot:152103-Pelagomonas_calceolata.AAC.1
MAACNSSSMTAAQQHRARSRHHYGGWQGKHAYMKLNFDLVECLFEQMHAHQACSAACLKSSILYES